MKLVITGALGHIGSRLIHSIEPGEFSEVVLIDNLLTQRFCSLFDLPEGVNFRFVEADIMGDVEGLLDGAGAVVHLAAITNATASFGNEEQVEKINYLGTERIARACIVANCPLVFLSTTSVYGTAEGTVDEDCSDEELKPQSPYAESKLRAERLLTALGNDGLRFITCRLGTIYGVSKGMRFHTAINKFAWQSCLGEPLTVWSTALHQKRPYLDLGDAVRALKLVLERQLFDNRIYNVLTENLTIAQVVDTLREYVPDVSVKFVDSPIMNQLSYNVCNQRFRSLGFEFKGSLKNALGETVSLLRNVRY